MIDITKLNKYQLCRIISNDFGESIRGRIMTFTNKDIKGSYYFKDMSSGSVVILFDDMDFTIIPYKESIKCVIDHALDTNDVEWFKELCYILNNESEDGL